MCDLQSLVSILFKSNLPESHIQQLHLRIWQVIYFQPLPCFLKPDRILLIKIHQFEKRLQVVIPRGYVLGLDTVKVVADFIIKSTVSMPYFSSRFT